MTDNFIPTLTHATERDIDLLLVEELYASRNFVNWVIQHVDITKPVLEWEVKHSKNRTRSRREIDISLYIVHKDKTRSVILIENKLDAEEQPNQAESYREELRILSSKFELTRMIIVCPQDYQDTHQNFTEKFDVCLTYQAIQDWFINAKKEAIAEMALRYKFRAELLSQAIYKHRRGYTPVPDSVVGDFNA